MEAISSLKDELVVKMALLQSLSTAEKVNMNEINRTIDEIGALKTKMMKEHAALRQEIRKLLTKNQRLVFDMHPMPHQSHPHMR